MQLVPFFLLLVVNDSVKYEYILILRVQTPGIYLESILDLNTFRI